MHNELIFPNGINLLKRWQNGDLEARNELHKIFDRAIDGDYDANFAELPPEDRVHVGGSVNLMTLNPDYSPDVFEQRFLCVETVSHLPRQAGSLRGLSGACV